MDTALLQTLVAGVIVAGAAAYLSRGLWRSIRAARRSAGHEAGCGGEGCGCDPGATHDRMK
jgi:hypothetical protein